MTRGRSPRGNSNGARLSKSQLAVLRALHAVPGSQPAILTRRLGVLNLYWHAVEAAGASRGPKALRSLVDGGYVALHPTWPDHGDVTPSGKRALERADVPA